MGLSDCNDLTRVESKCFSKLACKPLLFEDDCESERELSQRPAQTAGDLSSLTEPPTGQRCSGRNYQGRRCCTPENPCNEGEGDCDGPGDGGGHDGHKGCKGELKCGSNNCKKFGAYYHEKDDCCEKPSPTTTTSTPSTGWGGREGASALKAVEEEHGQGHGSVEELTVDTPLSHKIGSATHSHAVKGMAAKHADVSPISCI